MPWPARATGALRADATAVERRSPAAPPGLLSAAPPSNEAHRADPTYGRGPWLLAAALVALLPALAWLPYRFPPGPGTASASAALGYGNAAAFLAAASWCVAVALLFAFAARRGWLGADDATALPIENEQRSVPILELLVVALAFVALYFPPFLARTGPFVEDHYFLTALHRMDGGLVPYRDLETVYGPLMLYAPHGWLQGFGGYSAVGYYWFLALLEALSFTGLLWLVGRHHRDLVPRWLAFGLLGIFLFNTLLGISWNGARRILPLFLLWNAATGSGDRGRLALGAVGLGVLLAWSHDFAALTVAGMGTMTLFTAWRERRIQPIVELIAQGALAGVVWLGISAALLGSALPDYLMHAVFSAGRFAREASFPFYWTGHSLSTFLFLGFGFAVVGCTLVRGGGVASGDRMLMGAAGYTLLALSSGLNRADMWHLASVPLPLMLFFLAPLPRSSCPGSYRLQRVGLALIVLQVITYTPALLPSGSFYAGGLFRGAFDVLSGVPRAAPDMVSRHPSILRERSSVQPEDVALAAWLAEPEIAERPVLYYGWLWAIDKEVGARKLGFPTDDFLLSDAYGEALRRDLQEDPRSLVVIRAGDVAWLEAGLRGEERALPAIWPDSTTKRILRWLSTIHYLGGPLEMEQKYLRWERSIGSWVVSEWEPIAAFGDYRVFARPPDATAP